VAWPIASFQSAEGFAQDETGATVFLPAPRTLRQHLVRASKAVEEGRHGDAVMELGALLAEQDGQAAASQTSQDFFLGPFSEPSVRTSLKREAQRLLSSMPEAARELYQLQFGGDARELLDAATRDGDLAKLAEVTRKYFHTQAGYEATMLLGRLQLDLGHPLAAAMCFQRLVEAPSAARQFDPELSMLLAACWSYADRPQRSLETLAQLRQRFPGGRLEIGNQPLPDLSTAREAEKWLAEQLGGRGLRTATQATDWVMFRGDASRNAESPGGAPLPAFRWQVPTAADPSDENLIQELMADKAEQREPMLPVLHPLAVDNVILMRTPERLLAIDFETGKRVWEYPWWEASYDDVPLNARPNSGGNELEVRREKLTQRLWQDVPYGQVSSDGKSVYMLDNLRYATPFAGQFFPGQRGALRFRNPDWPESHNELVALDLKRQGSLRWRVGGARGEDEPKLAGAFFLGAPLPLSGQLYSMAELSGEIRLLALDADTGRLEWSQQLVHVADLTVNENPLRRLAGATPSYADGVLVCPTSAGAVVAVDIATRSLLWGFQYQAPPNPSGFGITRSWPNVPTANQPRWLDASVTIADGAALVTPVEDDRLFCLDLDFSAGKPRWFLKREGELADALYVAGVHDGKVVVVTKHKLLAFHMKDGQAAWAAPVQLQAEQGEMPSGRGFMQGPYYYLPTTTAHLLQVDLSNGSLAARIHTNSPLGNVICYQDEVISHSANTVSSYFQIEPLQRFVAERLAKDGNDAWALARQGELLLHQGKSGEALAVFERAHELNRDDETVRGLLVSTFLAALREDFAAHRDRSTRLAPLIELPKQRQEYLRLLAQGFHESGNLEQALAAYLELAELPTGSGDGQAAEEPFTVKLSEVWSVRLDRWIQARVEQLYGQGVDEVRRRLEEFLKAKADTAANRPLVELQRDVQHFSFHPLCDSIRLELARQLTDAGRWLEAERMLQPLRQRPDETISGAATARLAALYTEAGRFDEATQFYRELGSRWADVVCLPDKTGQQLLAEAQASSKLQPDFQFSRRWPTGRATVETRNEPDRAPALSRLMHVPVHTVDELAPRGLVCGFDARSAGIFARDRFGQPLLQVHVGNGQQNGADQMQLQGHLGVVYYGSELMGVDLFEAGRTPNQTERWRLSMPAPLQMPTRILATATNPFDATANRPRFNLDAAGRAASSMGPVNEQGVFYQRMRTLFCVDALSGETIWSQGDIEQGAAIFGDEELTFVALPGQDRAVAFRSRDGERVATRDLPAAANRWALQGRHVLAWDVAGDRLRLYLRDIWQQRDLWSESFSRSVAGKLIGDGNVAVLDADGRLVIRSLQREQPLVQTRVEADSALAGLHVIASPEQYLLCAVTSLPASESRSRNVQSAHELGAPVADLRIYAVSRQRGTTRWSVPAVIPEHGLLLQQPSDSPALWFVRSISTEQTLRSPRNSNHSSVLCLDRRDGRVLFSQDEIPTQPGEFNVVVDPGKKTSTLYLPNHSFTVTFTDEPVPPEPPAQLGIASSLPDGANRIADLFGAGLQTLKQQVQQAGQGSPFEERKRE